jgi:hypothetical protein
MGYKKKTAEWLVKIDEIADDHELKTHSGCVLLPLLDGICSRPNATYL